MEFLTTVLCFYEKLDYKKAFLDFLTGMVDAKRSDLVYDVELGEKYLRRRTEKVQTWLTTSQKFIDQARPLMEEIGSRSGCNVFKHISLWIRANKLISIGEELYGERFEEGFFVRKQP